MSIKYNPDWNHTTTAGGYLVVRCPDHPRAWKKGKYVYVHVIVAEQKIGRLLEKHEVVHHIDKNKFNNTPENIVVKTRGEHTREHHRPIKYLTLVCTFCEKEFIREKRKTLKVNHSFCSKKCANSRKEFKHGTGTGYSYHRCRCEECKNFNKEEQRKRRLKIKTCPSGETDIICGYEP